MLHRRLVRPVIVTGLLACICYLWLVYHSDIVVLIPKTVALNPLQDPVEPAKSSSSRSRIAKVTVAANSLNTSVIHQALRTHQVQNELHGYTHFITTGELVGDLSEHDVQGRPRGAWSKPAYLLSLIVAELTKPEAERLEWLFWFDADTVVMNPHTPLEVFLPPSDIPSVANIHLLMASNWDGLNSGAFGLRVHPWSVSILSAVLAYPLYKEDKLKKDRFRDQSAFQWLLQSPDSMLVRGGNLGGTENWADVPMRWFNSLPINNAFSKRWDWIFNHNMTGALFDNGTREVYPDGNGKTVQPWKVMQGDMLVHFAGTTNVRQSWMGPWLERAVKYLPEWSNATRKEELKQEARFFWNITASRIDVAKAHEKERAEKAAKNPGLFGEKKPTTKQRPPGKWEAKPDIVDPTLNAKSGDEAVKSNVAIEVVTTTQSGPVGIPTTTQSAPS
ncbi:uncharacterized protein LY89DRAFT_687714 [Mollisia scopiformis]|uniref:Glycosyltransferase family 34 protein n=1 Tax=Mollisia scopiformis TaxID=149040 RepID=A0A194WYJ5_MOLSC|nr:uncharacterized protein LY89DRAFT_687714 [Mollisia scopiformis]KUJ12754.1 hypothetical protein LY89DRAFT_687714 [Mollisia scopiformis]